MNTFALLTVIGALGVVFSFFHGLREIVTFSDGRVSRSRSLVLWRMIFDLAVFLTILAAPLAR